MSEKIEIGDRNDFELWAVERAREIVGEQGSNLVLAAKGNSEEAVQEAANALGRVITEALLEVLEGLLDDE